MPDHHLLREVQFGYLPAKESLWAIEKSNGAPSYVVPGQVRWVGVMARRRRRPCSRTEISQSCLLSCLLYLLGVCISHHRMHPLVWRKVLTTMAFHEFGYSSPINNQPPPYCSCTVLRSRQSKFECCAVYFIVYTASCPVVSFCMYI